MATQEQMDATYNYMDEIFRLTFGDTADITCALYDGDFSKSLAQAQKDKHDYILDITHFRPGGRLLDIGCGWGPMLKAAQDRGGHGVGITLSAKHAASCRRQGLDAHVRDWKDMSVDTFGRFDVVVSLGAFEHFCSAEEYREGKQEKIYQDFFRLGADLLPDKGMLFLQTVTWGKAAPANLQYSLKAKRGSNEYILAVLEKFYPGTWLPLGEDQILTVAAPHFEIVEIRDGRKDYVETTRQWNAVWRFSPRKALLALRLVPYFLRDKDFRYRLETLRHGYMGECLNREVMDHRRMVFQKR